MKSVATAVALTLAAVGAHAQSVGVAASSEPSQTATKGNGPVILSIYDPVTKAGEAINLSQDYGALTAGDTTLTTTAGTATTAAIDENGTGIDPSAWSVTGGVASLNFGVIPSFISTFGADDSNAVFWVTGFSGAGGGTGASKDIIYTDASTAGLGSGNVAVTTVGSAVVPYFSNWTPSDSGVTIDTSGTGLNNPGTSPHWTTNTNGAFGGSTAASICGTTCSTSSALYMFNLHQTTSGADGILNIFGSSTGAGYWEINAATGDLTWNVPVAAVVPLPAAAWLLLSGLAGLGAVGRRRVAAA